MSTEKKNNNGKNDGRASAEVTILGENLVVVGNSSVEYIKSVADFVNKKMMELNRNYPRMSRNKIIALGAMNLADELIKALQEVELLKKKIKQIEEEKKQMEEELQQAKKLAQHYQNEYEELVLLLEEVEE
ncbi:hypothetical protein BBF96_09855 [Anoxybacter fermentans]|uniref:Cell division protein ZapA n=1 Tax=Anoxybacter fermentans TaxID=1323375 RepID=A0A3Q9HR85_9FIRM|nr:cell division protein ZapA [Anoxybacter fermentans]AZR73662.1 hypothetical protein BBF96_09855 [Anoxybacter fermentans]